MYDLTVGTTQGEEEQRDTVHSYFALRKWSCAPDAHEMCIRDRAAAVKYNSYALMAALRLDPLSLKALDDLRGQVLNDMKGEELSEALTAYGASLEHNLSSSAMNRMPASKRCV